MIIDDFILSSGVESDTLVIWLISVYVPIQHLYILIDGIESSGGDPYPHGKEIGPGSLASSFSKFFFAQTHTHSLSMSLSTPNCLFKTRLNTHRSKEKKRKRNYKPEETYFPRSGLPRTIRTCERIQWSNQSQARVYRCTNIESSTDNCAFLLQTG